MQNSELIKRLSGVAMPAHVGIIMDGNGRWAQKRGLPRTAGHRAGANVFGTIAKFARDCGIKYITFYTFSTENWKRPDDEVRELMRLLHKFLKDSYKYKDENIRMRFLGDIAALNNELREDISGVQRDSEKNTGITVNMAINYGGRDEIVRAARAIAGRVRVGEISPEEIDESLFCAALDTEEIPDCDLIIRPSGERRTSNFLIWQAAYAELVFMDILWPDFTPQDFTEALLEYAGRSRRFGGVV